jgi:hypothetical protein
MSPSCVTTPLLVVLLACAAVACASAPPLFEMARAGAKSTHPALSGKLAALEGRFAAWRANFVPGGSFNEAHVRPVPAPEHVPRASVSASAAAAATPSVIGDWRNTTGYVNVLAFGAVADGATDNTAAFARAIAAGRGGRVFVPAGSYSFSSTVATPGIVVPAFTALEGVNAGPFSADGGGSVLIVRGGGATRVPPGPFVSLQGPSASIVGFAIVYAAQSAGAQPIVFPPCIQGSGDNMLVKNMLLVNPYIGIDFSTFACGRHTIDSVYGQPVRVGISVDQCYDIGRIRHVHFWPFFAPPNTVYTNTVAAIGVTFHILRTDWEIISDVFSWGYSRGMRFGQSPHGACNGQFTDIDFDNVDVGIQFDASQPYGLFFSNLNLANAGNGAQRLALWAPANASTSTQVDIRGLSVWGQFRQAALWQSGGKFSVSDFIINAWQRGGIAIEAWSGRVAVRGGYFRDLIGTAVKTHKSVDRAIVTGNDLVGNALACDNLVSMCEGNLG